MGYYSHLSHRYHTVVWCPEHEGRGPITFNEGDEDRVRLNMGEFLWHYVQFAQNMYAYFDGVHALGRLPHGEHDDRYVEILMDF